MAIKLAHYQLLITSNFASLLHLRTSFIYFSQCSQGMQIFLSSSFTLFTYPREILIPALCYIPLSMFELNNIVESWGTVTMTMFTFFIALKLSTRTFFFFWAHLQSFNYLLLKSIVSGTGLMHYKFIFFSSTFSSWEETTYQVTPNYNLQLPSEQ